MVSCVYTHLMSKAFPVFASGCLFKDIYSQKSLGRWRQCLPQEQNVGMLTVQSNKDGIAFWSQGKEYLVLVLKDLSSPNSGFLSCNATLCISRCHLAFFMLPCGNWGS